MQLELLAPLVLGLIAYRAKALDALGAMAGIVMGYTLIFSQNFNWFVVLLMFFGLSTVGTSLKSKEKREYRILQSRRTAENVLANGFVPLAAAVAGSPYAFIGALATATADTLSSEIGVLSKSAPRNILTGEKVRRGANGGVSLLGNMAMIVGSLAIAVLAIILFNDTRLFFVAIVAGIIGCTVDSVLGILFENKGIIGNGGVNFFATLAGALSAVALSLV